MITRKQQAELASAHNQRTTELIREQVMKSQPTIAAKTEWVWTEEAERRNPDRQRAGEPVWSHWQPRAPKYAVEDGLVIDKSDFRKEGQADLFEFL